MLAIHPHLVRMQDAEAGFTGDPQQAIEGIFAEGGVAALSRNGTLGDPARASAEHGERYWAAALEIVAEQVAAASEREAPDARTR